MAVASTPLVAAPSCPAWAKHRRGRQPQFDGKPCEPAEEEDMWLCLADGRARSTADLKRLATAARVRAKRAGDAAAASKRDQQARDQRRRQRAQHDRRAAPAVAKTVRPERVAARSRLLPRLCSLSPTTSRSSSARRRASRPEPPTPGTRTPRARRCQVVHGVVWLCGRILYGSRVTGVSVVQECTAWC